MTRRTLGSWIFKTLRKSVSERFTGNPWCKIAALFCCLQPKSRLRVAIAVLTDLVPPTVSERILERDPMEEIRRAFKLFDDDGTGKISLRNLRRVAKEIGDRLEDDELCVSLQRAGYLVYLYLLQESND